MTDLSWALCSRIPMGWDRARAGTPRAPWVGRRLSLPLVKATFPCPTQNPRPSFMDTKGSHNACSECIHPTSWPPLPLTIWPLHPWAVPTCPLSPPLLCSRHATSPTPCTGGPGVKQGTGDRSALLPGVPAEQGLGDTGPCVSGSGPAHLTPELCSDHLSPPSPCPHLQSGLRQAPCMAAVSLGSHVCWALGMLVFVAALQGGCCHPILWLRQ